MSDFITQKREIISGDYVICSCEGTAEQVIMNILLDNDLLFFNRQNLIREETTRIRTAGKIAQEFLGQAYARKIHIMRVIDSKRENFKLPRLYCNRPKDIDEDVLNIYTHPEIEMLIILAENKYQAYKATSSKLLPSQFCKKIFKKYNVKSNQFVQDYFADTDVLIKAIKDYKRLSNLDKNELCLADLLK